MSHNSDQINQVPTFSLGGVCIGFKLNRTYITDNLLLYVSPNASFCSACFQRRYLSQIMQAVHTNRIGPATLELARTLDKTDTNDALWHVYAIREKKPVISFELVPYEDCLRCCSSPTETLKDKAALDYQQRLRDEPWPDYEGLRKRVFSFGFARQLTITRNTGIPDTRYDQIMADNYAARVYSRAIDPAGNHQDSSTLGVSTDSDLRRVDLARMVI